MYLQIRWWVKVYWTTVLLIMHQFTHRKFLLSRTSIQALNISCFLLNYLYKRNITLTIAQKHSYSCDIADMYITIQTRMYECMNVCIYVSIYNPNSRSVGTFFKIWIKWQLKDFQITWANISFTIEHIEYNKCLNGYILHFYPLNELISNLMPATGLKNIGTGATKVWKSKTF